MRKIASRTTLTRRQFALAGAVAGAVTVAGCRSGSTSYWETLSDPDARILTALCDQIIPADDFPSASQAGVVTYIDRQLARHYMRHVETYRKGVALADAISRSKFGRGIADIAPAQQLQVTLAVEHDNRTFFDLLREHTMEGYYGSPRHGGNRDAVSWRMLGIPEPPVRGRAQYDLRKGGQS